MNEFIAFAGNRKIASGALTDVARKAKSIIDRAERAPILIFDSITSRPIEIDFRGPLATVLNRLKTSDASKPAPNSTPDRKGPGRPKLGVVAREITLLPRHWDWLNSQPSGASATLRRLVEQARKQNRDLDEKREAQESAYRFMSALAGNLPGYEEALRALFAGKTADFHKSIRAWPKDLQAHATHLAQPALT